ncbi:hypothetical protein TI04_11250, partial [Achromatium sp. WMS2]
MTKQELTKDGTILIIDDNLTNLQILFRTLSGAGYHVIPAQGSSSVFTRRRIHQIHQSLNLQQLPNSQTCMRLLPRLLTQIHRHIQSRLLRPQSQQQHDSKQAHTNIM